MPRALEVARLRRKKIVQTRQSYYLLILKVARLRQKENRKVAAIILPAYVTNPLKKAEGAKTFDTFTRLEEIVSAKSELN